MIIYHRNEEQNLKDYKCSEKITSGKLQPYGDKNVHTAQIFFFVFFYS